VLAYERASFDVVGEVAPVALQEGHRADEAVPNAGSSIDHHASKIK